ncbi:unnamed protein product [Trichobilharzia regenti]|nr:unnamed protein product [Trichobilharzia regenti]
MDHYSPQISKNDYDENDWDAPSTESRLVMSTTVTSAPLLTSSSVNASPADEKLSIHKTNDISNKQIQQEDELLMTTSVKNYRYTQENSWYMFRNCFGLCCFKPILIGVWNPWHWNPGYAFRPVWDSSVGCT